MSDYHYIINKCILKYIFEINQFQESRYIYSFLSYFFTDVKNNIKHIFLEYTHLGWPPGWGTTGWLFACLDLTTSAKDTFKPEGRKWSITDRQLIRRARSPSSTPASARTPSSPPAPARTPSSTPASARTPSSTPASARTPSFFDQIINRQNVVVCCRKSILHNLFQAEDIRKWE